MERFSPSRKAYPAILPRMVVHFPLLTALVLSLAISAQAVLIDFEDIQTTGPGTGGQAVIENQYRDLGIIFNGPVALDYSRDLGIDNYAHSPTRAIETCYSAEFCNTPVEMTFEVPVKHLKLWVGGGYVTRTPKTVSLQAYNRRGEILDDDEWTIEPTESIIPISIPLEVTSLLEPIYSAKVGYLPDDSGQVDNAGLAVDDVQFEVNEKPQLELSVSPAATLFAGETFVFSARATDPEKMPLQYSFYLDGISVGAPSTSSTWRWTLDSEDVGSHLIEARASDGLQYAADQVRVTVRSNSLPSITSLQMDPQSPRTGSVVTFTVGASDTEGDPMEYSFRLDRRMARDWSKSSSFSWTPSEEDAGDHILQALVRDDLHRSGDNWSQMSLSFSIPQEMVPRIEGISIAPEDIRIGSPVIFSAIATDPEGDPLQYLFLLDGRQARFWTNSSEWSWTPLEDDSGKHVIAVKVRDGKGRNPEAADDEMEMSFHVSDRFPIWLMALILAGGLSAAFILRRHNLNRGKDVKEDSSKKGPDAAKVSFKAHSDVGSSGVYPRDQLAVSAEISFRIIPGEADAQVAESMIDVIGEELVR